MPLTRQATALSTWVATMKSKSILPDAYPWRVSVTGFPSIVQSPPDPRCTKMELNITVYSESSSQGESRRSRWCHQNDAANSRSRERSAGMAQRRYFPHSSDTPRFPRVFKTSRERHGGILVAISPLLSELYEEIRIPVLFRTLRPCRRK